MPVRTKRIKDLPSHARPLEKLLEKGVANLSDEELLALLIGTGTKQKNALALARALLVQKNISHLASLPIKGLAIVKGIGKMKAARIAGAFELGKRVYKQDGFNKTRILTTQDILFHAQDLVAKQQEHLIALYINARHELVRKEIISIGNLNVMRVTPRDIFLHGLKTPCAGVLLVHNHPSGTPTPSEADITFTKHIQQAGDLLGIPLVDHVIVANEGYFSFRDSPLE